MKTEIKGHIAKAEKQIEKLTWESKTRRGEIVRVMKNLNEGGRFKWVVKSGKLYEESFFSTKKTAVKWAKEIIETYNKARTA